MTLKDLQVKRDTALAVFGAELLELQRKCPHTRIALDPGFRSYGTYHARRICETCGLEEIGTWWSYSLPCMATVDGVRGLYDHWQLKDHSRGILNWVLGRTVREVKEDEFMRFRP